MYSELLKFLTRKKNMKGIERKSMKMQIHLLLETTYLILKYHTDLVCLLILLSPKLVNAT